MIDHEAAKLIEETIKTSPVYLKSELSIKNPENKIELGLLYGSTLYIDPSVFYAFAELDLNSV